MMDDGNPWYIHPVSGLWARGWDDGRMRDPERDREKILRLSKDVLLELLRLDGTSLISIEGMPEDAQITGVSDRAWFSNDDIGIKVWSSEFPILGDAEPLPGLQLTVTVMGCRLTPLLTSMTLGKNPASK